MYTPSGRSFYIRKSLGNIQAYVRALYDRIHTLYLEEYRVSFGGMRHRDSPHFGMGIQYQWILLLFDALLLRVRTSMYLHSFITSSIIIADEDSANARSKVRIFTGLSSKATKNPTHTDVHHTQLSIDEIKFVP